jgi:carbon-monoxide dehydrogenase small subunit
MSRISLRVNGAAQQHEVEPRLLLVHYLREVLGLTGTHVGCDTSQCGACTVLVDGTTAKACTMLAVQADGSVTTIEGLSTDGRLHPCKRASGRSAGRSAASKPRDDHGRHRPFRPSAPASGAPSAWLEGNLCRCTGYHNIVKAVQSAARKLSAETLPQDGPARVAAGRG